MLQRFNETIAPPLGYGILGILAVLLTATLVTAGLRLAKPGKDYSELSSRVKTWWWMAGIFATVLALGRDLSLVFFAFLSFLALKEYLSLIPTRRADRRVLFWVYLAIPIQYYWVHLSWYGMFIIWIPVYMFLFLPLRMMLIGETAGFLKAAGTLHWGLMTMVFSLSHAAFLLVLPAGKNLHGGGAALVFFLVVLTELNDVFQYCWGKSLGRHPVVPAVSPKKTWEGLIGGIATTTTMAWLLAPHFTPFTPAQALGAGLILGVGGFIGDVTISLLKRDLGVKDSGSLLPGHGGILDRVDSLAYTAPLFFHYTYYLMADYYFIS